MNVVFPFLQVLFFDHNKWTSSNSWVASCSILKSKCNVNAQYKPTSSWKASCSILMLKCKRVRSPRQRRAFDIPPWNSASQNKQHNSRHFFLTNSQYFSDICRIFLEYFQNPTTSKTTLKIVAKYSRHCLVPLKADKFPSWSVSGAPKYFDFLLLLLHLIGKPKPCLGRSTPPALN